MLLKLSHLRDRVRDRHERTNRRRSHLQNRRGFSLTELTLALGIIALFATVVTLAVVRGQLTSNTQKADRAVVATLDRLVEQASNSTYGSITNGTFTRPESEDCDDPRTSCPTLFKRQLIVNWSVSTGGSNDDSEETIDWVEVVASTDWAGTTFTSSKKIEAPTPNWREGWGVLRVDMQGLDYTGDLYLVDTTSGKPAAGAAQVINGSAWLSAPLELCGTTTDGCVLALGPYGALSVDGVSLDAVSAMTEIQLRQDDVARTSVLLRPRSEAAVTLLARNGAGETSTNPHLGSACVWARFHDGLATRTVPFCNDDQPDQIVIDSYNPDATRSWLQLAVPVNVPVKLYIDHPDGTCSAQNGTFRWSGSSWIEGGTCTGWTWGTPATIGRADIASSVETFTGSSITLNSTPTRYELLWTTSGGLPASGGNDFHPLWAFPRNSDLGPNGTCSSSAPHCNSGAQAAPVLTSPRTNGFRVAAVEVTPGSATSFSLSSSDYDWKSADGPTVITVTSLPSGTLVRLDEVIIENQPTIVETALSVGDVVVSESSGTATAQLRFYAPSGNTQRRAMFSLANGSGNRSVHVTFAPTNAPHSLRAEPVRITQGSQGSVNVLVIGTNGSPLSGVTLTPVGLPVGITAQTSTTGADGWATIPLSVTNTPAGITSFSIQTSGGDGTVRVSVTPRAGSIVLSAQMPDPVLFDQGTTTEINFNVVDRAGSPRTSVGVAVWATRTGGARTSDVYATSRGCETDSQGGCTVTVVATSRAAAGSYVLNVAIEGVEEQLNLQVEPKPFRANANLLTIAQGSADTVPVTIVDGSGIPVAGVIVSATSTTNGLTFSQGTTNSNGVANIGVTAADQTISGVHLVQLSGGGSTGIFPVRVTQTVSRITVSEVLVAQGESVRAELVAYDSNNKPVPGAVLSALSNDGIIARATPTGRDGRSIVDVRVPYSTTPTRYLVSLSSSGQVVEFLPVRVIRGIGSVVVEGRVSEGETSNIRFKLFDHVGSAVAGRSVTITPMNNALKISGVGNTQQSNVTLTSNNLGVLEVEVSSLDGLSRGATGFNVSSGATTIIVYAQVITS